MGIHYNAVNLQKNLKQKFVMERLLELGVTKTQTGKSIHDADYEELKYELVLQSFREIDAEKDENKWF